MSYTKWDAARRAWKFLRQWKIHTHRRCCRSFPVDFRPVRRFIKRLIHPISTPTPSFPPHYAERQFSFNDKPIFHLSQLSCINPKVEFERRVGDDDDGEWDGRRLCGGDGGACDYEEEEEEGIDLKAEKFIKMFYEEMKMQSQVSYVLLDEFSDADEQSN